VPTPDGTIANGPGFRFVEEDGEVTGSQPPVPKRIGHKPPLIADPIVLRTIIEEVFEGAYLGSAAETAGISRNTAYEWYSRGRNIERAGSDPEGKDAAHHFYLEVRRARGGARTGAEKAVYKRNPELWLARGPGRLDPEEQDEAAEAQPEGWSEQVAQQQGPIVLTFDIVKASGGLVPPALQKRNAIVDSEFVEAEDGNRE